MTIFEIFLGHCNWCASYLDATLSARIERMRHYLQQTPRIKRTPTTAFLFSLNNQCRLLVQIIVVTISQDVNHESYYGRWSHRPRYKIFGDHTKRSQCSHCKLVYYAVYSRADNRDNFRRQSARRNAVVGRRHFSRVRRADRSSIKSFWYLRACSQVRTYTVLIYWCQWWRLMSSAGAWR